MIKARLYNEVVAKTRGITSLKLIHIYMDYSARMETILVEMRALFATWNCFFRDSPMSLEKVPDLTEFPDLSPTEVLHNLQTPTTLRTNQESSESRERQDPRSDAKTKEAGRTKLEEVPTPPSVPTTASDVTPPLLMNPAPIIPSLPAPSPGSVNFQPGSSRSLSENARISAEFVMRQVAFTQTPNF